ncbi:MAG: hypothetical protein RL497_419 [Pseudomonadota bacterium]|jgi:hypothetical protein
MAMEPYHSQAVLYPSPGRLATELNLSGCLLNLFASLRPMVSADGIKCASGLGLISPLDELEEDDDELEEEEVELEEDEVELEEDDEFDEELEEDEDEEEFEELDTASFISPGALHALTNTRVELNSKNVSKVLIKFTPARVNLFEFLKCSIRFPYKVLTVTQLQMKKANNRLQLYLLIWQI